MLEPAMEFVHRMTVVEGKLESITRILALIYLKQGGSSSLVTSCFGIPEEFLNLAKQEEKRNRER